MKPGDLQVAHHAVQLPSLRMHYVEVGRGPLVVLLHGFPETWWSWRHQLLPLAEAGFRVVAPDLRGYGETDKHGPYDLDTTAGDVCALIESLGGERKVRVVGHDWGGGVAWHLAATRPAFCDRLAVLNCPHPSVMRRALLARPSLEQLRRSWYFFFFQLPLVPEWVLQRNDAEAIIRVLRASVARKEHFSPDELRPFRDAIQRPGAASAMVGWYRAVVRRGFRHPLRPPTEGLIEADALLIWGLEDPALSFQQLVPGTEQHAPRLQVREVPGAGHFVHAEAPEVVNPLLKAFLA